MPEHGVVRADRSRTRGEDPRKAGDLRCATQDDGKRAASRPTRSAGATRPLGRIRAHARHQPVSRNDLAGVAARPRQARRRRSTPRASRRSKRERKDIQTRTQELQARRNALSKQIGVAKGKGEDASALLAEVARHRRRAEAPRSASSSACRRELRDFLLDLPNLTHASTPVGRSSDDNVEVRRWGTPRSVRLSRSKDHTDLGEALGLLDFATAAKLSGARFSFLRGGLARLHRALAQFMLDTHTREHGYTECYTPYIVNAETLVGTTQLPKFEADMFAVTKGGAEGEGETLLPDLDLGDHADQHRARRDPRRPTRCRSS